MTTEPKDADARSRAEARFKRMADQKTDAEKVWAEQEAQKNALLERTTRLRELRLAKEQAVRDEGVPVKKTKRAAAKKPVSASA